MHCFFGPAPDGRRRRRSLARAFLAGGGGKGGRLDIVHPGLSVAAKEPASLAQWIRRVPTEHEILGAIPGGGNLLNAVIMLISRLFYVMIL